MERELKKVSYECITILAKHIAIQLKIQDIIDKIENNIQPDDILIKTAYELIQKYQLWTLEVKLNNIILQKNNNAELYDNFKKKWTEITQIDNLYYKVSKMI